MKKRVWIAISSILVFIPVLIPLGRAHGLAQQEKWVARYNGPGNGEDGASAIAVDSSGNVYVTGSSSGSSLVLDYATIKYSPNGKQVWINRYNGPGNSLDWASAIAVDGSGNVYVTGHSKGSGTDYDYATIKYSPNGNQLWVARYNGPGNGEDWALAIAVDGSGNVYVTGQSKGSGTDRDYATIKYSPNGKQIWVNRYNGPDNGWDQASAIAVDSSGNVYVTGTDYTTIKYSANGKQLWVKSYNGPGNGYDYAWAIAVDGSGNVYVTGQSTGSGTDSDYATIKYNTNGNQLWVNRYNGPGNWYDGATAIAVDGSGNVYVTGTRAGTGPYHYYDYATIKYSPNGKQLWVKGYNGPGSLTDWAWAIATDDSGNIYVTGESQGSNYDYATIKYSPNGTQLWVKRYNGPGNGNDGARAIAVDGSGNVYITGYSHGSGTEADYATIKY
jgi:uncharacterized delta-60 repeat protein